MGVGDASIGVQRGERTMLVSPSLSLSLRRSNSQQRLTAFLIRFEGGDVFIEEVVAVAWASQAHHGGSWLRWPEKSLAQYCGGP